MAREVIQQMDTVWSAAENDFRRLVEHWQDAVRDRFIAEYWAEVERGVGQYRLALERLVSVLEEAQRSVR